MPLERQVRHLMTVILLTVSMRCSAERLVLLEISNLALFR